MGRAAAAAAVCFLSFSFSLQWLIRVGSLIDCTAGATELDGSRCSVVVYATAATSTAVEKCAEEKGMRIGQIGGSDMSE
jgi:hypothetical protein